MTVLLATISDQPLDPATIEALVRRDDAGAVVAFTGRVRNHDAGRSVTSLDYTAHPDAESVLARVAHDIASQPEVLAVAVTHRIGSLQVGDPAIVAAVSAAHRGAAFAACQRLVDEVKAQLPMWKRQQFAEGDHEWVGAC